MPQRHQAGLSADRRFGRRNAARCMNVSNAKAAARRWKRPPMAASVKDFRCGPWRKISTRADCGPRWKSSQGGSCGGLGSSYGESAQTPRATAAPGLRLMVCLGFEAVETMLDVSENAACAGPVLASYGAITERAHAVWARPARCDRKRFTPNDRRFVMRPAPLVVRATSVFARAGISR